MTQTSIDLRSDTVTLPTTEMRQLMHDAEVGDDVYGEDPTVNQLASTVAERLGKEAGLFLPSGTQSNLCALLSHCERGEEYIVGQVAHTYKYEAGGAAVLGSIQPQPIEFSAPGVMPLDKIVSVIKPDDIHFAKTKLVCLENTQFGSCLPQDYPFQVRELCNKYGLNLHLDGARLFNAVVKQKTSAAELCQPFDSISVCLSKGLGAPVGSVLVGDHELIRKANHWRKMLGGGMRQAGMLAAAGLYALDHHVERLAADHTRAEHLTNELKLINTVEVLPLSAQTNMVFVNIPETSVEKLNALAKELNITLPQGNQLRLVTHLNIDDGAIARVVDLFKRTFSQ